MSLEYSRISVLSHCFVNGLELIIVQSTFKFGEVTAQMKSLHILQVHNKLCHT